MAIQIWKRVDVFKTNIWQPLVRAMQHIVSSLEEKKVPFDK